MSSIKTLIEIKGNESLQEKIKKATEVFPSKQQIEWQRLGLTAFLHFGMNTFCDVEWGDGTADPQLFNPTEVDCEQWASVLKKCGFKGMILTCKHHDGFCLWPSAYTDYSIIKSPYKNGNGDIVRQASDACKKYGLKFGVYLSPWDRHDSRYGDSPKYNEYFMNQLTELLTNYGDVFEVWFDGACAEGPNGKRQEYDWNAYYCLIRKLQPNAVISIEGPDVRWVGNEAGVGREEEWSVIPGYVVNDKLGFAKISADAMAIDIASDKALENLPCNTNCLFWSPAQVDTSIRPGWFYHSWENGKVKSLYELAKIYENSVGANAQLLLNIPPDKNGNISIWDVDRLTEFGEYIKTAYKTNLIDSNATVKDDKIIITFNTKKEINCVIVEEDISLGQRVSSFTVYTMLENKKITVANGKTIGNRKIVKFSKIVTDNIVIEINKSRAKPIVSVVGVYLVPNIICPPTIKRSTDGLVTIVAEDSEKIMYSINEGDMVEYQSPFFIKGSARLTAEAHYSNSYMYTKSTVSEFVQFGVLKDKWEIIGNNKMKVDLVSFAKGKLPYIIFPQFPAEVIIDMKDMLLAKGVQYAPISSAVDFPYNVFEIDVSVSLDNEKYTSVFNGTLDNIKNNPIPIFLKFKSIVECRFLKFTAIRGFDEKHAGIGTISVVTVS